MPSSRPTSNNFQFDDCVMSVHPSGYYAWKASQHSPRAREDQRLPGQIKQAWLESGGAYGYRKMYDDLRALGERCGKHRGHC